MSFRRPRPPTVATRTPIPPASYTRPSACTCQRTRAYTARRAKRTRIAPIRGSITGSPAGTTGTASPYAAAGDSSRIRAAIQASAPSSMAIWEARPGSPDTLNAPASSPTATSALATIQCIRSCLRRIHGRTTLKSSGAMHRFTESCSRREAQTSSSPLLLVRPTGSRLKAGSRFAATYTMTR
jgi:hypothetical protein